MFFRTGHYDYRDDPVSTMFLGLINRLLRSTIGSSMILFASIGLLAIGVWNFGVDYYVIQKGVEEEAAITNASNADDAGYTVEFAYRYGSQPDNLRMVEPWLQKHVDGKGYCNLLTKPGGCRKAYGTVTVTYLPDNPGVYVVKQDQLLQLVRGFITILAGLVAGATGWNILRMGAGQESLRMPSWADWGFH
ncbi:MAG: hypothetical protein KDB03_12270 [Planctomycetales bacterium]|nr:hypothetical protein [Planctomycetales bacterium]